MSILPLEIGKSYVTADGRETGPLLKSISGNYFMSDKIKIGRFNQVWHENGTVYRPATESERGNDRIVARVVEPPVSPVQEVTKRHLVAGTYGIVLLYNMHGAWRTELNTAVATPAELRAAAKTLIEIADYLDSAS